MDIIVKDLTGENEIIEFQSALIEFYKEIDHKPPQGSELNKLISDFSREGIIKIAKFNNELVGLISLVEATAIYAGGKFGIVNELWVKSAFRSKGIGRQLLSCAEQVKRNKGWSRLELSTPDEARWQRTITFYLKEGFIITGKKMKKE